MTNNRERSARRPISSPKLHAITFCTDCGAAIPERAMACFACGSKQHRGEKTVQVLFCEKCGNDFPSQAMACFHCGHLNPRHPYFTGHITR